MIFIIPKFEKIFKDFDMKLPDLTLILMAVSRWFVRLLVHPAAVPVVLLAADQADPAEQDRGRTPWTACRLWMPMIGKLIEKTMVARTMRTLGTLVASGVPILEALSIVRETCTNAVFERMYQRVYESIREGDTIAQPLKESRLVDDMVVNMIDVGEETGDLDTMLYKIADVYDEEVNVLVEGLLKLAGADHDRDPGRDGRDDRDRAVHAADQAAGQPEQVTLGEPGA